MAATAAKIGAAAAVLISQTEAGLATMSKNFVNYANSSREFGVNARTLTDHLLVAYLEPYGCWCHFDEDQYNIVGTGHGAAKDPWDQNCRNLQEGYNCAILDAEDRGETCVPWEAEYPIAGADMDGDIIDKYCQLVADGDLCVEHTCLVETFFIKVLSRMIIPGQPAGVTSLEDVSRERLHSEGFNIHKQCNIPKPVQPRPDNSAGGDGAEGPSGNQAGVPGNAVAVPEAKQCCGNYPSRFPYKPSVRSCCHNKNTFDEATHECCINGEIMAIGAAC